MVSPSFFDKQRNLAVLIDAENTPTRVLGRMLDRVRLYGVPMIRNAYGDWTKFSARSVEPYKKYGVRLIQQTSYVSGKNASDIRLVIDAMDMLHAGNVQGFCIVSSDSDFTGLCNRLRESGMFVMGMGQSDVTHNALKNACNLFIYIDDLVQEREQDTRLLTLLEPDDAPDTDIHLLPVSNPVAELRHIQAQQDLKQLLKKAYRLALTGNNTWVDFSKFANMLQKLQPDFNVKSHGYAKLSTLIKHHQHIVALRTQTNTNNANYEVRLTQLDDRHYTNQVHHLIADTYKACIDEDGWVDLSILGNYIQQVDTYFDCKNYGYSKLSALVKDQPYMEMKSDHSNSTGYLVRLITD